MSEKRAARDSTNWQTRLAALNAAATLVAAEGPGKMHKPVDSTLTVAKRFERYLESGE